MTAEFRHVPVLLSECMEALKLFDGGIWLDGTLGGGGHSEEILKRTAPSGRLIAVDRDAEAIAAATARLGKYGERFEPIQANFKEFADILDERGVSELDGILLDLGVSSYQLDNRGRGFSYLAREARLDMRMDQRQALDARSVVNEYEEKEIEKIIREYGEDRFARNIAKEIVAQRKKSPLVTAGDLIDAVERAVPKRFQHDGPPAMRTFQAIRIEVNGELKGLGECVREMTRRLKKGGRIAILTFHSLEDRIVKQAFRDLETDCVCPKDFPVCVCGRKREAVTIGKKPIAASEEEIGANPRARSAKLRVAERV